MKLNVNFSDLFRAAEQMGAAEAQFSLTTVQEELEPIDVELRKGLAVSLEDVEIDEGLLSYQGRQILLYIQDHNWRVGEVLAGIQGGNKYHVSDCSTLESMREKKRFERYVVTNDLGGEFFVSGVDRDSRRVIEGHARLAVCKNCLRKLNYQGYELGGRKREIFDRFRLDEFFSTFSSFFPHMPSRFAGQSAVDQYTDDWREISESYRRGVGYICENCEVNLSDHSRCLHVHHLSGVRRDNSESNLRALCVECHRAQPCHEHLFVPNEDRSLIRRLRREQALLTSSTWQAVLRNADPALHGVIEACRYHRTKLPVVGFELRSPDGKLIAELELAWPDQDVGIAIRARDRTAAEGQEWTVWRMSEALDAVDDFITWVR